MNFENFTIELNEKRKYFFVVTRNFDIFVYETNPFIYT